jgi:acetolactate synthase-1/3 small subunit
MSRMTIVARGDDQIIDQIMKQLDKLHDVLYVKQLPAEIAVCKELALVKVATTTETRVEIIGIIDMFNATIVDVATRAVTVEVTGDGSEIDTFIKMVEAYGINEMTRTGIIALQKGNHDIKEDLEAK